jgi:hypothetical protein
MKIHLPKNLHSSHLSEENNAVCTDLSKTQNDSASSLPSDSQLSPSLPNITCTSQISKPPNSSSSASQPLLNFTELLQKILPVLINLVFASDVTSKIESFLHLGQLLHVESIVSNTLSELGLSSLSSSRLA